VVMSVWGKKGSLKGERMFEDWEECVRQLVQRKDQDFSDCATGFKESKTSTRYLYVGYWPTLLTGRGHNLCSREGAVGKFFARKKEKKKVHCASEHNNAGGTVCRRGGWSCKRKSEAT